MADGAPLDFLVVGHVTHDLVASGWRCGGAAFYASATVHKLGLRAGILTRAPSDSDLRDVPPGVRIYRLPSNHSTEFVNTYDGHRRTQRVTSVGDPIRPADVPGELAEVPIVLLGPVIGELDPEIRSRFTGQVGIGAQGWLRRADGGNVAFSGWSGGPALDGSLAVFASSEDAPQDQLAGLVDLWLGHVPIVIVTAGPQGGRCYLGDRELAIPVYKATQVDPTGAGDVFAAAFLARYAETSDPYEAVDFSAAAAACSVEGIGISAIPDREMISARRREGAVG